MIPFNKPYLTGKEAHYMYEAVFTGKLSGNGMFTQRCQAYFEKRYGFKKCLLTTSCTDALEMAAILCNIEPGDEVIIPSFTFVSTALAFVRQGAKIVFADSYSDNPNIDADQIEALITPKTKVIVPVHYAGVACDMNKIMELADKYNLLVVEDAAQAVDSFYLPPSPLKGELKGNTPIQKTGVQTAYPSMYAQLKELVVKHRNEPTQAEEFLWKQLQGKNVDQHKFRRQHIIADCIADFVCLKGKLVIEVDGKYHDSPEVVEYDKLRTQLFNEYGFRVLRFTNDEVLFDIENVLEKIKTELAPPLGGRGASLGSIGHLAAFSFHETKNIISGEGGMLAINDDRFTHRAEIIWEKGTNRAEFFRGEVNKYGWVDIGSSFLPSEVIAAFLWAQIEHLDEIQNRRKLLRNLYYEGLKPLADTGCFSLPALPDYATNNAHMFYLVCNSLEDRTKLIDHLKQNDILAVFHYLSLHSSPYYTDKHDGRALPNCDMFADRLVRLPLFYELTEENVVRIVNAVKEVFSL